MNIRETFERFAHEQGEAALRAAIKSGNDRALADSIALNSAAAEMGGVRSAVLAEAHRRRREFAEQRRKEDATPWQCSTPTGRGPRALLSLVKSGAALRILSIGANDGDFTKSYCDDAARLVLRTALQQPRVRAILVEPNPPIFKQLVINMRSAAARTQHGGGTRQHEHTALNVAVCSDSCPSGKRCGNTLRCGNGETCANESAVLPLFVVSDRYVSEVRRHAKRDPPRWARSEISSMVRANVLAGLRHARFHLSVPDLPSYVDELRVRCLTPARLLEEANLTAPDVSALFVDVEGMDVGVVRSFLWLTGFRASAIVFESKVAKQAGPTRNGFERLKKEICERRGYECDDEAFPNFFAWRSSKHVA